MSRDRQGLSIYLHIPFCTVRCSYCAFNVYTNLQHQISPFVTALVNEIVEVAESNPGYPVHTIYFGGGTPSLLSVSQYERILEAIRDNFNVLPEAEISTEANPNDLSDLAYVEGLRTIGLQRLSIGVQSAVQSELEMYGRLHDSETVAQSVENARAAGFDNLNLDLIYGSPRQTMVMWKESLETVIALQPEHLSLYALGLEPKTAMEYWVRRGKLPEPDDDLAADMYEHATQRLAAAGFEQYEISNWAKPGYESIHNTQYWRNLPYLGLGPGAHGYAGGKRYKTIRSPHKYIERLTEEKTEKRPFPLTAAVDTADEIGRDEEISETIMMGMRLLQSGISLEAFEERFGVRLTDIRGDVIEQYQALGAVELTDDRLRFTERGRFISNRVLRDLV